MGTTTAQPQTGDVTTRQLSDGNGLQGGGGTLLGINASDKIGFFGGPAVVQPSSTGSLRGAVGTVIRMGVARGVFSNEAGLGSAPIAAAAARTDAPVRQALVSMTGTFIDTLVVCTMTGLVLVMGGLYTGDANGAALTAKTFDALLPGPGGWIVTIGLLFFSYSTILGWSYYGEKCAQYLLGTRIIRPYRIVYTGFVMAGTVLSLDLVWAVSDVFNGLMALPNLVGVLLLSGVVIRETRAFLDPNPPNRGEISVNPREFTDQNR